MTYTRRHPFLPFCVRGQTRTLSKRQAQATGFLLPPGGLFPFAIKSPNESLHCGSRTSQEHPLRSQTGVGRPYA